LPGKRAWPVPRGRRRGNAPPLPDWRTWYYLLESEGLNVQLVNSRHARQLAGRPKTDQKDAQQIARLAEMGLLRPSFVPPPEIRALRDLTRTRLQLGKDRAREWQRLEKLLEGALIKLSSAVYSMARNKTARDILEAIVAGERDPRALAARAHGNIKGGTAAITEALEGMLVGEHHPVLIRVHLDHITLLDRLAAEVEDEIEAALDAIPAAWGITADGVPSAGPGPDAVVLPAAERLAEIPGVSLRLARAIIAETGLDMARFQTADHLVSWAGLAPVARQSGPRQRKPSKGQGDAYLKMYCVQAANGAATTETFLGERLRRLSRRLGGIKAKCAVGRSILVIIWQPPGRPRGQVQRPRPRLARRAGRPRPQDPQPPPPAQGPRPRHHHQPGCGLKTKTAADQALGSKCHGPLNHARVR
jgi:transposase